MKQIPHDLRTQTLDAVSAARPFDGASEVEALIAAWLAALDEDDLSEVAPAGLAPLLWEGFVQAQRRVGSACQIVRLRYSDGRGDMATALLVLNDDMPYRVDSMVMFAV